MFGHQDGTQDNTPIPAQSIDGVLSADVTDQNHPAPQPPVAQNWQHPGVPLNDDGSADQQLFGDTVLPEHYDAGAYGSTTVPVSYGTAPTNNDANDLIDIKQQALNQLSPLVGHLDQTPEDKFRTTMMMIQASDNASLIKDAYAAANAIPDEKAKAQALLDIVNEINYFTQTPTE
jgi:hypothetical protein